MSAGDLARVAGLLADDTRAAMCLALLDGRAWTAGELARHTGVAPSTATEHINRLIDGGLFTQERQGRHRYVRLAGPDAAHLVETISAHAGPPREPVRSMRQASVSAAIRAGRTCYDHLAGQLGVAITDALTDHGLLDQEHGFALTDSGVRWLDGTLGVQLTGGSKRPVARSCVDWTERRFHLGGVAGAGICRELLDRSWLTRVTGTRAVRITPAGQRGLRELLDIDVRDGICHTAGAARSG